MGKWCNALGVIAVGFIALDTGGKDKGALGSLIYRYMFGIVFNDAYGRSR